MVVQDSFRNDLVSSPLKNNQKHRLKQRFDVQRKLGQGTYGKVQLAVNRETGQEVAVKTIKKNKIETEQDLVRIRREIQIMSSIQHPHITHIYEVFENKDKIVLVMQFASGGELYDYLSEKKVLSDLEARRIFRQIAAAVYYCHKNKICHRDLKLENILLDEKGNAKIADFGLSNVFDDKNLLNTYCGSPLYASPEIVKGVPYYGPEVDCWSMGVLLYTLVYGAMPFDGSNFKKLVTQISEGDYFEPKKKSNASDLIRKLLTVNPSKRATIVDICVDYWVNHGYEHSLLQVAEDMANLTPVRFDLLLALAPEAPPAAAQEPPPSPLKKDIPDEDEEDEEEEDEYNGDTAANSFAFVKGSRASQLSVSSPNLQEAVEEKENDEDDDDFLPADIAAALQAECGKRLADSSSSFGASLARISSLSHKSKKPRKSDSTAAAAAKEASASKTDVAKEVKKPEPVPPPVEETKKVEEEQQSEGQKPGPRRDSSVSNKSGEFPRKESLTAPDEKVLGKKMGRPPGKIVIPKTFDSPQSTPSPKPGPPSKTLGRSDSKPETEEVPEKPKSPEVKDPKEKPQTEDINKNIISSAEPESEVKQPNVIISEEKKNLAKGILKKGIAKAKLAERRMSKQSSVDSEVSSPCSTPASTGGTPEPMPSFFKTPKPYAKEEESTSVSSKAEIKLSSAQSSTSTLKNVGSESSKAPLWDSRDLVENDRQLQSKNLNWSAISSTIDSEMSNWREQMEESLRRLSPDDERSSNQSQSFTLSKIEDDKPLVPIARSYKKFTFTKDGACITETKKIYTTPGADGSWTKVEKKTKITTRPGNVEEFEKFRDMHLRSESASLARSDSQSSSGSNDVYDDIFDSWTGDTMMCNMRKMNNMFHKFSRDPFMRRERRRNPFRFFRRTESERNELRQRESSSENEEDYDVRFEDSTNPVVYGSQGLWQLLRSANRAPPGRITIQHEPVGYSRSVSQDREGAAAAKSDWKRSGSRASSGYNTGTRSQSRDRTESPREKVLRFVFESPREEKWGSGSKRAFSRHNPRRDSGVGSDGYESEYSVRHSPTDDRGIRGFMKSWSKEFMSPPPSAKEQLESLPEARKHRVEQWLDMTTADSPSFEIYSDGRKVSPRASVSSQHSGASSYATMRPSGREYVAYGRSSSDRVADCADFFSSTFEERRNRSQSFHKEETPAGAKMRFRHSPVGEERSYLSDGSGGSSAHRVNFTVPAGGSARYVRHFSQSDSPPVVQMRVSINRGSPPKGLWEQQEQPREPSPLPGIRQFSTEVQHCIGGESTPDDKPPKPSGKSSSPYKLPAESSLWDLACMENGNTNHNNNNPNNNNKHDPNNSRPDPQSLSSNGANTPDSLEDLGPQENLPLDEVQVKPLGVLWGEQPPRSESILSEQVDLQQRCLEKTTSEVGSIWNQKSACHPFDLLKNLLSDDGLESFSSAKCVASSLEADRHITVIDNMERLEGFRKATLMDDLQSPKEVLRQAMKICDSFK